jgi:large subunit ribosomal protein L21
LKVLRIDAVKEPGKRCSKGAAAGRGKNYPQKGIVMYAVIKTGGKQYRVTSGEKLRVELLEAEVGAAVQFAEVLAIGDGDAVKVGAPLVAGATVNATVLSQGRADKVHIFKMRRRKHYKKSQGHRQSFTEVRIDDIVGL